MASKSARNLRKHSTKSERTLWELLRKRKIFGHRFRRQHPIGPFIVDFICLERRVILEVDGDVHDFAARQARDIERDEWLSEQRFRVLRLTNEMVITDPEMTLERIQSFLAVSAANIVHHPLHNPPPSRGRETKRRPSKPPSERNL